MLAPGIASAASFKPFGASVPYNIASGGSSDPSAITFTITNNDSSQLLGSVQLGLPQAAGFQFASGAVTVTTTVKNPKTTATGSIVQSGCAAPMPSPCAEADNLYLGYHDSASITVHALTPAACSGTYTYPGPLAKQANSFNGSPGNPLNYTGAALTSTIGACSLHFDTGAFNVTPAGVEPHNALVGTHISGADYTAVGATSLLSPFPAAPVTVDAIDDNGRLASSFDQEVKMALNNPLNGVGNLSYTAPVDAASGVATFSDLRVDSPNDLYSLTASNSSDQVLAGSISDTSRYFTISNAETNCMAGTSCGVPATTVKSSGNSSTVTSTAQTGAPAAELALSYNTGSTQLSCAPPQYGGYVPVSPDGFVVDLQDGTGADASTLRTEVWNVTLVSFAYTPPKQWLSNPLVCYWAPQTFPVASGGDGTGNAAAATFADGRPGFLGVLQNCPSPPITFPCVDQKNVTKRQDKGNALGFDVTIPVIVPPGQGDPYRT